ncbi:MAG: ACP S-malonyltransferase [Pseudomonadota bacterium]
MSENRFGFAFPGQGSQRVGMLEHAYERFSVVRDTFTEASDTLSYDMWDLICHGDQGALNLTETTQPVLLTCSVALWRAWLASDGSVPTVMAGHSLGEFSALVCAGALAFPDAVRLVKLRGAYMQNAVPLGEGAMAAIIGLDDAVINQVCHELSRKLDQSISAVNFNSPGQVVIAGHTAAVEQAVAALKEAGAKRALPLPVSAPFHTDLMLPAGEQLAEAVDSLTFTAPEIPVIHNVHAETESSPAAIKALLVQQISSPVQWTECVKSMATMGANSLVECGPGKVLSGLTRRIDKSLQSFNIEEPEDLLATIEALT